MKTIRRLDSRYVVLAIDNVDTDQIIPARFLKGTTRDGLGDGLFADWRYDREGEPRPDFSLPSVDRSGASVLVAGVNFGCGSSREHAAWALMDFGFRAVVSPRIADIFLGNALKNGLLAVEIDEETHASMVVSGGGSVTIEVESQTLTLGDGRTTRFELDPFARYCFLNGVDELEFLLGESDDIDRYERGVEQTP